MQNDDIHMHNINNNHMYTIIIFQVLVLDGKDMGDGKNVEAFVTIQIGDLRKETRVSNNHGFNYVFLIYIFIAMQVSIV